MRSSGSLAGATSPGVLHAVTIATSETGVSLNCEGETRKAKRLKCETAVRNGLFLT
jgi:hypothetical protein